MLLLHVDSIYPDIDTTYKITLILIYVEQICFWRILNIIPRVYIYSFMYFNYSHKIQPVQLLENVQKLKLYVYSIHAQLKFKTTVNK